MQRDATLAQVRYLLQGLEAARDSGQALDPLWRMLRPQVYVFATACLLVGSVLSCAPAAADRETCQTAVHPAPVEAQFVCVVI